MRRRTGRTQSIMRTGRVERLPAPTTRRPLTALCQCGHTWREHRFSHRCRHVDVTAPTGTLDAYLVDRCLCEGFR